MRERFLTEFDKLWLDCLNGDSRETGKLTPEGKPDPSVFSTDYNREGIRVGTTVCVVVRKSPRQKNPAVRFRQFWGVNKRKELLESSRLKGIDRAYTRVNPSRENKFSFVPENVTEHYKESPALNELCAVAPFNGPVERRGNSLIRMPAEVSEFKCLSRYLDVEVTDGEIRDLEPRFMHSSGEFHATESRKTLKGKTTFQPSKIVRYPFKPFDVRLAYLDAAIQPLFSRPSPHLLKQRFPGNAYFITRDTADKTPEGPPFYFSPFICDYDSISGHARHFPMLLKNGDRLDKDAEATLFAALGEKPAVDQPVANLSAIARDYLRTFKFIDPDADPRTARCVWMHALAIGYSPAHLAENADGVRNDWPRIPFPALRKTLEASAALGEKIAALLNTEAEVAGVTDGRLSSAFKTIGTLFKIGGGGLNPNSDEFSITVGWGHFGQDSVTMPAKGKLIERPYTEDETAAIELEATAMRVSAKIARRLLGETTCDIYLNGVAYWRNIPLNVWNFHIGGYQVIKKWLSYREKKILGRAIKPEDAREVMNMARRIAAILLLQPKLDENYQKVKAAAYDWPKSS